MADSCQADQVQTGKIHCNERSPHDGIVSKDQQKPPKQKDPYFMKY